jgi:hypothetical protein
MKTYKKNSKHLVNGCGCRCQYGSVWAMNSTCNVKIFDHLNFRLGGVSPAEEEGHICMHALVSVQLYSHDSIANKQQQCAE